MEEQKLDPTRKIIICDTEKCNGCQLCEYACSIAKEKTVNPRLSRIRSVRIEPIFNMAIACRKCEKPPCKDACPRDAVTIDNGIIRINKDKCNGCGWCVVACDFGSMRMHIKNKIIIVCDYCDGTPKCVEFCPKKALKYETLDAAGADLSKKAFVRLVTELKDIAKKE